MLAVLTELRTENKKLRSLKRSTFLYLIPEKKGKGFTPSFDPDKSKDIMELFDKIEACKSRVENLKQKVAAIDKILSEHPKIILRPVLEEIKNSRADKARNLARLEAKVGIVLGHILSFKLHSLAEAERHKDVIEAKAAYEDYKQIVTPMLQELDMAISDLEKVIS